MTPIAAYLDKLVSQRDELADNLVKMGLAATHDETLETLVPKVLRIIVGNTEDEIMRAEITETEYPTEIGFIRSGEEVRPAEVISISVFCRIAEVRLRLEAADGNEHLDRLTVTAPGWTVRTEPGDGTITAYVLTLQTTDADTRWTVMEAIEAVRIVSSGHAAATLTMDATGSVESGTFAATGSCRLQFQLHNWEILESKFPTWTDIEGKTWQELEAIVADED